MSEVPAFVDIGDSVIYQSLKEEVVILNMASQQYYGLDDVGASMWKMLLDQREVEAVARCLVAEYEVGLGTVRNDLNTLVLELIDSGLLKTAQPQM